MAEQRNEKMETQATTTREIRTPAQGTLTCLTQGSYRIAKWVNLSRVGAQILLYRELNPGETIWLSFESPFAADKQVILEGRVVWCAPRESTRLRDREQRIDEMDQHVAEITPASASRSQIQQVWYAGIHVLRDNPDAALAFATLGYLAQRMQNPDAPRKWDQWSHFRIVNGRAAENTGVLNL